MLRHDLKISQRQLALTLDVVDKTVRNWESGRQRTPKAVELLMTLWVEHPFLHPPGLSA
jgi:DNA-binding transcriptional regulator YiaG